MKQFSEFIETRTAGKTQGKRSSASLDPGKRVTQNKEN